MKATARASVMWAAAADVKVDPMMEHLPSVPEDCAPCPEKTNRGRQTSKKNDGRSAGLTKKVLRSSTTMPTAKDKPPKVWGVTTASPRKTRTAAWASVTRAAAADIRGNMITERIPAAPKGHIPRQEQTNQGRRTASKKKEMRSAGVTNKGILKSTTIPTPRDQAYNVWGVATTSTRKMRAAGGASVTRAVAADIKGDTTMGRLYAALEDITPRLEQINLGKQTTCKKKEVRSAMLTKKGVPRSSTTMTTPKDQASKVWGVTSRSSRKTRAAVRARVMRANAADPIEDDQNMRKVDNRRPNLDHSGPGSALANEEQSTSKAALSSKDIPRGQHKMVQQVSTSMSNLRRSFLPAPRTNTPTEKSVSPSPGSPHRSSPVSGSKKIQKDLDSKPVSPKRTSATSNFSPGHSKSRTNVGRNGFNTRPEADRQLVQRLKEKCEEQSRQLLYVQEELKRASLGFEVFAVTTQHFFNKNERGQKKEKELYLELANIRDEVAVNTEKCEKLQKEKEELERNFEDEVKKLQNQQVAELHTLEERLLLQYQTEMARLQSDHTSEIARIKTRHQKQVEDMTVTHEATVQGLETHHTEAIAVMQDEHMYQVEEMKCNHELEKKTLEDNFENLRLSLQDQVDTLTFQSHSLRDRAKRFEEALRKSSDEQFQAAFAPFQHLEEDLSSLKQVLEMKNQQIHEQEKRIMELEKLVDINVRLEERIQVLQQQNEDLKVRIDKNVAVTRHLSEENANLHESVEKESEEKKRLSRTNEELIWKLQTGEPMSPVRLSPSSALYHSVSGSLSPSKVHAAPR